MSIHQENGTKKKVLRGKCSITTERQQPNGVEKTLEFNRVDDGGRLRKKVSASANRSAAGVELTGWRRQSRAV